MERLEKPLPFTHNSVTVRLIRRADASKIQRLLCEYRTWLEPWEASYPGDNGAGCADFSMAPVIRDWLRQFRAGTLVPFVIEADGEPVGQLTVSDFIYGSVRSCQLGYWIAEKVAGRGIMPTAVAMVLDYLLVDARMHRVEINIVPENQASLRVVEKLGLRLEGKRERFIHINGEWRDHLSFAITAEEREGPVLMRLENNS